MGSNTNYDSTYLTAKQLYRANIVAADASPDNAAIPIIRLDVNRDKRHYDPAFIAPVAFETTNRAYNGHLELFCHFTPGDPGECDLSSGGIVNGLISQADPRCHADIMVWAWSSSLTDDPDGRWCLVHNQSILIDTLIALRNIPNTQYKVTVQYMNGGSVSIVEQHTL
jgi:hypothetical protein